MIDREQIIVGVLHAAGGRLIGRVRLQKMIYLLEQMGLQSNFHFDYHHYGPFSRDVDNAVADGKEFGLIEELLKSRQSDGAPYSIFTLNEEKEPEIKAQAFGSLGASRVEELAKLFARTNVTVLELAATVHWLWRAEDCQDWKSEVTKRKGLKVQGGRLDKAIELLRQLGISPPDPVKT